MQKNTRQARAEFQPLVIARSAPTRLREGSPDGAVLWLTGGATLLLWTALALLLTSA